MENSKKLWKQVRQVREWKQVKDEVQGLGLKLILRHLLFLF